MTEWADGETPQKRGIDGDMGGTTPLVRLRPILKKKAAAGTAARAISERHRHRYVDMGYREVLQDQGLVFSGVSPDGVLPECRNTRASVVYRGAVSSGTEVAAICAASAFAAIY